MIGSWVVIWVKADGTVASCRLCRTTGSLKRTANYLNELASMSGRRDWIGVVHSSDLLRTAIKHTGLPTRQTPAEKKRAKVKKANKELLAIREREVLRKAVVN